MPATGCWPIAWTWPSPPARPNAIGTSSEIDSLPRAVDIILPDVCRAGGISEGLKIARLADVHHTPWAAHVSMGTPVHIAAALHVAAATPNFLICECPTHQNPIGSCLLRAPIVCEDGFFHVPEGPGLGIELDEDALERVTLNT